MSSLLDRWEQRSGFSLNSKKSLPRPRYMTYNVFSGTLNPTQSISLNTETLADISADTLDTLDE